MLGLIFVTWEKYLAERFGSEFLGRYRNAIGETPSTLPLAARRYGDEALLAGVEAASNLSQTPIDTLLCDYGRYFTNNGLTSHLCAYLLSQIQSGQELLLAMRQAHARLRLSFEGTTPPLFEYEPSSSPNEVILMYRSERHLCSVLLGAIYGAAERYHEKAYVVEQECMKHGAPACRFVVRFSAPPSDPHRYTTTPEQLARQQLQKQLIELVLTSLPEYKTANGLTLADIRHRLELRNVSAHQLRPAVMLEAIQRLQFAGLIMSTAQQADDDLTSRRYWRLPAASQ
ncbi:MAG: hypothetical protein NVSMB38_29050 [Ktedonobacteraceae bacterium]